MMNREDRISRRYEWISTATLERVISYGILHSSGRLHRSSLGAQRFRPFARKTCSSMVPPPPTGEKFLALL